MCNVDGDIGNRRIHAIIYIRKGNPISVIANNKVYAIIASIICILMRNMHPDEKYAS